MNPTKISIPFGSTEVTNMARGILCDGNFKHITADMSYGDDSSKLLIKTISNDWENIGKEMDVFQSYVERAKDNARFTFTCETSEPAHMLALYKAIIDIVTREDFLGGEIDIIGPKLIYVKSGKNAKWSEDETERFTSLRQDIKKRYLELVPLAQKMTRSKQWVFFFDPSVHQCSIVKPNNESFCYDTDQTLFDMFTYCNGFCSFDQFAKFNEIDFNNIVNAMSNRWGEEISEDFMTIGEYLTIKDCISNKYYTRFWL